MKEKSYSKAEEQSWKGYEKDAPQKNHGASFMTRQEAESLLNRTNIEALHSEIHKAIMDAHDANDWQDAAHYILDVLPRSFDRLFGSKCLPDEEKSEIPIMHDDCKAEPKFKVGDMVRCLNDREVYIVMAKVGKYHYALQGVEHDIHEDLLEPYTEPTQTNDNMEEKYQFGEEIYLRETGNRLGRFMYADIDDDGSCIAYLCDPENKDIGGGWRIQDVCNKAELDETWILKDNDCYWCINDMLNPVSKIFDGVDYEDHARVRANNCFRTKELARQAAEAVKKCLEEFHENHKPEK